MASKATCGFSAAAVFVIALFSGCGGSGLQSRQADGGLGGSGGVSGGGSRGVDGTSASGGTSEHGGTGGSGGSGGNGDVNPDAGSGGNIGLTGGTIGSGGTGGLGTGGVAGSGGASGGTLERDAAFADARPDSSVVDVPADARPDSSVVDVPADVDNIRLFMDQINGIWLIGWMGDMNHFSWVRIRIVSPGLGAGTADFLAGDDLAINFPYWQCSGLGNFLFSEKPNSILFTFPASCPSGIQREYVFDPFRAPGSYPKGAILSATVTPLSGSSALVGYKFPDTQCLADMTSCSDPL